VTAIVLVLVLDFVLVLSFSFHRVNRRFMLDRG